MDEDEVVPLPETDAEHDVYGASNPPVGTDNENWSEEPETVPETVPRPVTFVLLSVRVSDPENDEPDCVICHVMVPGPEESVAVPDHLPLKSAGDEGWVGVEVLSPPLQAANRASAVSIADQRCPERTIGRFMSWFGSVLRLGCAEHQIVGDSPLLLGLGL